MALEKSKEIFAFIKIAVLVVLTINTCVKYM